MKMKYHISSILFSFIMLVFLSCSSIKNITYQKPESKSSSFLKNQLGSSFQFETLSMKASVKSRIKGDKKSFKASIRIRKDSAIWSTISFAGKPIATFIISQDSVKYMNRLTKEYLISSSKNLVYFIDSGLNYNSIQDILVGNPIGYDKEQKYDSKVDSAFYQLSSMNNRKIKKAIQLGAKSKVQYAYQYWMSPQDYQINKQIVNNIWDSTSIQIQYSQYLDIEGQNFPEKESIMIKTPDDRATMELNFSKIKLNKALTFPFRISDKYTRIEE